MILWVYGWLFLILLLLLLCYLSNRAKILKSFHDLEEVTQQTQVLAELLAEMLSWHLGQLFKWTFYTLISMREKSSNIKKTVSQR